MGASWRPLGILAAPGASWAVWGASGPWPRGPLGGLSGASWKPLGASCGALGGLLGSWDHLGGGRSKEVGRISRSPLRGHEIVSWGPPGPLLGALGIVVGASWAPLGALSGNLGAILKPQKHIGSEKTRRQHSLIFCGCLKDVCLLGVPEGAPRALGTVLRSSWALLETCRKPY